MSEFKDPLDELIAKHKDAAEGKPLGDEDVVETTSPEEDIYGDNDAALEIAAEEAADAAAHAERVEQYQEEKAAAEADRDFMPARSLDNEFMNESVSFQSDKITDVNLMVQQVLAERGIKDGYFPADKRMHIMGDLIEEYHYCEGLEATDKFKKIVFDNWISATQVKNQQAEESNDESVTEEAESEDVTNNGPVINITNHGNAPVTVNVDDSIIPEITETRKVEINIVNVEDKEGSLTTVVEDADIDSVLQEHHTEINVVPVTLPFSGYRVVMRPMNWFDYLKMAAPQSNNLSDALMQRWTNIYNHIQSTSIGLFESIDDFLQKTKWEDQEMFEWALFVATSSDTEIISYKCNHQIGTEKVERKDADGNVIKDTNGNPSMVDMPVLCQNQVTYEYNPRSTIKVDTDKLPSYYEDVHNASVGDEATNLHHRINSTKQQLTLPDSKYVIEITRASAHDYINKKLPLISQLCDEYDVPFSEFERYMSRNPVGSLYILCALCISRVLIKKDDKTYAFSDWNSIRKVVDTLSNDDIQVIMQVFEKRTVKPVSFEFNDIKCSECGNVVKTLPVGNLFELMGFNLTRRLQSTEINLIDIAMN